MVQGWFYDQSDCFESFRQELTEDEQNNLFTSKRNLTSVERKYELLWPKFEQMAFRKRGLHRPLRTIKYKYFCYWAEQVYEMQDWAGGLKVMLDNLGTVEAAHAQFRRLYKAQRVRILSAADVARLLARYGYLEPERTPLLARGALRGAAILLRDESPEHNTETLEQKYRQEGKRMELENEAASFIDATEELASLGKWKMVKGQSLFCELQKDRRLKSPRKSS